MGTHGSMKHILHCQACGTYTMHEQCSCGGTAVTTKPPRYSPGKFAEHRQKARREELEKQGLL